MRLALQILLYLPLLLTFWYVHAELAVWIRWLPGLFTTRWLDLAGILAGTIICGSLAGAIFALPVAAIYRSISIRVALSISMLVATIELLNSDFTSTLKFTQAAMVLDALVLAAALPLLVYVIQRLRPNNSFKPTPLRGVGKVP